MSRGRSNTGFGAMVKDALHHGARRVLNQISTIVAPESIPHWAMHNKWRDVVPCYLSVQDRNLRIIETNALFRRDFGDQIGNFCYEVYKDRTSPCPGCPVLLTFEDGEDHTGEEVVITRDGDHAHVQVTSTPFQFDNDGNTVAVMEMSTNITQAKHLQHELDRSKQHFQLLFDSVPCYISLQDREYRILETNDLFREDFGKREGDHCYHAYKGRDTVCPDCPVEKTFKDGLVHSSEEMVTTRDGREATMLVYSMPVRNKQGEITSVMEMSTNITEVKKLQHQLAMMGLAVAGMAHRVKNILMGLEGGIFVVNTGFELEDKAQIDEGWEMVERNVSKISRLVKDLLYCSKEREPTYKPDVAPAVIVDEVYQLFRTKTEREGIKLELDIEDQPTTGTFDSEGIQNLVTNLTANAIDACRFDADHEGKQHAIKLRCHTDGTGAVVIQVGDNGSGIPEEHLHRVFKGFFSTKGTEGTGLGLLVVRKVVEEHGGTVSFRSGRNKGTTFTVVLRSRS